MIEWISLKDKYPTCNELVLITDGFDVIPGFYSSMHKWCEVGGIETGLDVLWYMPLPCAPEIKND